eukprot:6186393-Pleurochrysis_carterae.AAC.2
MRRSCGGVSLPYYYGSAGPRSRNSAVACSRPGTVLCGRVMSSIPIYKSTAESRFQIAKRD